MKRLLMLLGAAVTFAGCAEDSYVEDGQGVPTSKLQEIRLSSGVPSITTQSLSRGIGSVDGWNGHKFNVFAFYRDQDLHDTQNTLYLNNVEAKTPTSTEIVTQAHATFVDGKGDPIINYYPLQGSLHFVGYYGDGACDPVEQKTDDATQAAEPSSTYKNYLQIPVTIDGTQDLLIARAQLDVTQKKKMVQALIDRSKLTGATTDYIKDDSGDFVDGITEENKTLIQKEYDKVFSSYAARRDVQPNLVFNHQLVKLNFKVIAGEADAQARKKLKDKAEDKPENYRNHGVYINKIEVASENKGNINIRNNGEIVFNITPTSEGTPLPMLAVKESDGIDEGVDLDELCTSDDHKIGYGDTNEFSTTTGTAVGVGLMLMPADKYTARIVCKQYVDHKGNDIPTAPTDLQTKIYENVNINLGVDAEGNPKIFEAGKSYNVTIKVYGKQIIDVTATLVGWIDGGDVEIDPEDDLFQ